MSRAKFIDYYLEQIQSPDFEIDQIRKELEPQGIPDEEIRIIVRLVDNEIQKSALNQSSNKKASELIFAGAILTTIGVGITLATYIGLIDMGNSFIVMYGPFLGGSSVLTVGIAKRKTSKFKR